MVTVAFPCGGQSGSPGQTGPGVCSGAFVVKVVSTGGQWGPPGQTGFPVCSGPSGSSVGFSGGQCGAPGHSGFSVGDGPGWGFVTGGCSFGVSLGQTVVMTVGLGQCLQSITVECQPSGTEGRVQ